MANPCCDGNLKTSDVEYDGNYLPNTGILTNDNVTQILQKLDQIFAQSLVTPGTNISVLRSGNTYKISTTFDSLNEQQLQKLNGLDGDIFQPSFTAPSEVTVLGYNFNYLMVNGTLHFSGYIEAEGLTIGEENIIEFDLPYEYFPKQLYGINGGYNLRGGDMSSEIIVSALNDKCHLSITPSTGASVKLSVYGQYRTEANQVFSNIFTNQFT